MGARILAGALALLLTAQAPPRARVDDLAWMSGRWETSDGAGWTEEAWLAPRAGMMLGLSRAARGGIVREFEYIRIQAGADGVPVYWASPGGGTAVGFRLAQADGSSATFENPAHDFPQRIRYVRTGDTMVATISKLDGSDAMSWTYRRQLGACAWRS